MAGRTTQEQRDRWSFSLGPKGLAALAAVVLAVGILSAAAAEAVRHFQLPPENEKRLDRMDAEKDCEKCIEGCLELTNGDGARCKEHCVEECLFAQPQKLSR